MPRPTAMATTRLPVDRAADRDRFFADGDVISSHESRLGYRLQALIGRGGFGQAYLARRLGASSIVPLEVCVKVSARIDGWLREAHFGQLLGDHPRAIRIFDVFPFTTDQGRVLYCLALEYAHLGDLSAYLRRHPRGWRERDVRREIAGLLQVLSDLHRGQLLHRDLTPMNVFVCQELIREPAAGSRQTTVGRGKLSLKLGDFGIARHQRDRSGVAARTLNPMMAPSELLAGGRPKWQTRDDVYQVGQLVAMLVKGDAGARVGTAEIRALACSDHLKEIIHRCIGERRKRYENAAELIEALAKPAALPRTRAIRRLKGVHLAFTGIFKTTRAKVAQAARRAGATVHSGPSTRTTVLVRGKPNKLQAAGKDAGLKLMEMKRLREHGHEIALLSEEQFWKLVSKTRKPVTETRKHGSR